MPNARTPIIGHEATLPNMEWALAGVLADGEIVGVLNDGRVAFWDQAGQTAYLDGQSVGDIELDALSVLERERLEAEAWRLGLQADLGMATGPAPGR